VVSVSVSVSACSLQPARFRSFCQLDSSVRSFSHTRTLSRSLSLSVFVSLSPSLSASLSLLLSLAVSRSLSLALSRSLSLSLALSRFLSLSLALAHPRSLLLSCRRAQYDTCVLPLFIVCMRACVRVFVCRCVHVRVRGIVYIARTHVVIKLWFTQGWL